MSVARRPVVGVTVAAEDAIDPAIRCGDYLRALELVGLDWRIIAPSEPDSVPDEIECLAGLLLTGGGDVSPEAYGQRSRVTLTSVEPERDKSELLAANVAVSRGLPVFGICRGIQLLNVLFGGTLLQDIATEVTIAQDHRQTARQSGVHWVRLVESSMLAEVCGDSCWVNSRHHQAIDRLGDGLTVAARADDGIVEAIQRKDGQSWLLGVQWHPENMALVDAKARALFDTFAMRCHQAKSAEERP